MKVISSPFSITVNVVLVSVGSFFVKLFFWCCGKHFVKIPEIALAMLMPIIMYQNHEF